MSREDIIRMARDAGLAEVVRKHDDGTVTMEVPHLPKVLMFAELVAAAEREACAKVCEDKWATHDESDVFAAFIRARGQA